MQNLSHEKREEMLASLYFIKIFSFFYWLQYTCNIFILFKTYSILAFEQINDELKELTPQIQNLRKQLQETSKYCNKHYILHIQNIDTQNSIVSLGYPML